MYHYLSTAESTEDKFSANGSQLPAVQKSSRICRLQHWCCEANSNLWKFLIVIQQAKSDATGDLLLYLSGAMGRGQIEHRLRVLMALVTTSLTGMKMSATHLSHFLDGLLDISREICTHYQGLELIIKIPQRFAAQLRNEFCILLTQWGLLRTLMHARPFNYHPQRAYNPSCPG